MDYNIYPANIRVTCDPRFSGSYNPLQVGDRIRIKSGYDNEGAVGIYDGKSNDTAGQVIVTFGDVTNYLLAEAIEAHPYTREERIERAIEDLYGSDARFNRDVADTNFVAALYAILDAGIEPPITPQATRTLGASSFQEEL